MVNNISYNYMSIYIGNDLEDRLEALEALEMKERLKALETENALLKKTMNTTNWYMKSIYVRLASR